MNLIHKLKGTDNFSLFINNIGTITAIPKNEKPLKQVMPQSLKMAKSMAKEATK